MVRDNEVVQCPVVAWLPVARAHGCGVKTRGWIRGGPHLVDKLFLGHTEAFWWDLMVPGKYRQICGDCGAQQYASQECC